MSSNPIEEFGRMVNEQIHNVVRGNKGITLELGTIGANMSLKVSSLGNAIPKGDYMVSLHLKLDTTSGLPSQLRGLRKGDRVLVAWVGTEPVVIDILVSS